MPKINHRLFSVFLFLKKAWISAFFIPFILLKIIGGFIVSGIILLEPQWAFSYSSPTDGGCRIIGNCSDVISSAGGTGELGNYINLTPWSGGTSICYYPTGGSGLVGEYMRDDCVMFSVTGGQAYAHECPACNPGYELVPTEYTFGDCKMILDTCVEEDCVITNGACPGTLPPAIANCSSASTFCFGGTTYVSCDVCSSSYNRALKEMITVDGCDNVLNLYQCNKGFVPADPCADCTSDAQWTFVPGGSTVSSGAYKRVYRECKTSSMGIEYCAEETKWSCFSGYYGTLTDTGDDSFSGRCTICPSPTGEDADRIDSDIGNNRSITSCYIPANTNVVANEGTYQFTRDCSYSNSVVVGPPVSGGEAAQ